MLFAITMLISYVFLDLINSNIADIWQKYIEVITGPNLTALSLTKDKLYELYISRSIKELQELQLL